MTSRSKSGQFNAKFFPLTDLLIRQINFVLNWPELTIFRADTSRNILKKACTFYYYACFICENTAPEQYSFTIRRFYDTILFPVLYSPPKSH